MLKKPATFEEQVAKLKKHGCYIQNEERCKNILSRVNYYRLSAYFLPYKDCDGNYKSNTDFNTVYQIYEFDRKLRNIIFASIEKVEIYLRTNISYYHAHKHGNLGYECPNNFNAKHNHEKFMSLIKKEIDSNKSLPFVKHHLNNYNGKFPLWVITELFTFGMLSYFYADLNTKEQKEIADRLYGTVPKNMRSWLVCCTDLRNICAHYGRLYYRIFSATPADIRCLEDKYKCRLFGALMALKNLYPNRDEWNAELVIPITSLIETYNESISLCDLGFPDNWDKLLRWT